MKKVTGLWIDHTHALVVMEIDPDEVAEIVQILSSIAKHVRYSGNPHAGIANQGGTEDGRDRHFDNLLNRYYDRVILNLRDATAILILGPGEAKYELQKRLKVHGLSDHIVAIKTADKMTDDQIIAEVRQYFRDSQPDSGQTAPHGQVSGES